MVFCTLCPGNSSSAVQWFASCVKVAVKRIIGVSVAVDIVEIMSVDSVGSAASVSARGWQTENKNENHDSRAIETERGSGRLSLFQNQSTKNGSDHTTSPPLFISNARFDLLVTHLLTLLLIGGQFLQDGLIYAFIHHRIYRQGRVASQVLG